MKTLLKSLAALLILMIILVFAGLAWFNHMNSPSSSIPEEGVMLQIQPGENLSLIAERLEGIQAIRSSLVLRFTSRLKNTEASLKTGTYRIEPGMSTLDIHDLIVSGRQKLHSVTIPEGWKLSEIAQEFDEKGIVEEEDFIEAASNRRILDDWGISGDTAEGFLYPDTYFFQQQYPAQKTIEHLLESFFIQLGDIYPEYPSLSPQELYRKIITASIIEREYRAADEAPLIASVFYNRLELGMPLQSCATVVYTITEEKGLPHPQRLLLNDLRISSPYNTYQNKGLPPSPISNPGKTALEAAFFPADTEYLYFVLQDPESGRHRFTRTLQEHQQARESFFVKRRINQ